MSLREKEEEEEEEDDDDDGFTARYSWGISEGGRSWKASVPIWERRGRKKVIGSVLMKE